MKVLVLGSGTGWPRKERNAAGYWLETAEWRILLDIGPGTLRRITEAGKDINQIDLLFISHWHPDHVADLVPYLFATRYRLGFVREKSVRLVSAEGFRDFYKALKGAFGHWIEPPDGLLEIIERSTRGETALEFPGLKIVTAPARHNPESLAVRIEAGGKSLVYTGDTEYAPSIVELAREADLLICECSAPEELSVSGHATPSIAARMAAEAGVKRLLLSHFYPPCEKTDLLPPARKYFSGEVLLASDLMEITI